MQQRSETKPLSRRKKKWKLALTAILGAMVSMAPVAWAAPQPADNQDQLQKTRQLEKQRQERQQSRDVFLQPKSTGEADYQLPEEHPSFLVRHVILEGEEAASFGWLQDIAAQYNGRNIGKQGIDVIVRRLGNALIDHGYITSRVLVPEQDLSQGELKLILAVGRIQAIRFAEGGGDWQSAFPCRGGEILNLRALEQGLEQLKRVPSQDVDFKIVPSTQPGTSDIVIARKQSARDRFLISLDDSGSRASGKLQSTYTYSIDNLLGKNDLFTVSYNHDAADDSSFKGTRGNSVYWSMPDGWWTYSLSYRSNHYKQTVPSFGTNLSYSGDSETMEVKAERIIQRDKASKTSVSLKLARTEGHNYLDGTELLNQLRQTTALEVGLSHRRYAGKATWDYQLAYRHGMPWLEAQDDQVVSNGVYTSRYGLWSGEIDCVAPLQFFGKPARYNLTLRGQYTNSRTYSSEWFSIGNRYTVRGFDGEQTLMAENGWYLRNELSFALSDSGREIYYGLDYGRISGPSAASLQKRELMGAVVGVRGALGRANVDLFVGWPLKMPSNMNAENPTFGFQMSWQV